MIRKVAFHVNRNVLRVGSLRGAVNFTPAPRLWERRNVVVPCCERDIFLETDVKTMQDCTIFVQF